MPTGEDPLSIKMDCNEINEALMYSIPKDANPIYQEIIIENY